MDHAKKMALVPHQLVSSLLAQQQLNSNLAELSKLDQEMKAVLDDKQMSADLKYKQYSQVLHRYMNLRDQELRAPVPIPIQEAAVDKVPAKILLPNILDTVPKQSRNQARMLLQHVQDSPHITWNNQLELELNGKKVAGSNIVDLIHDFSRPRTRVAPANGWQEFAGVLRETNIPREAIGNAARLEPQLAVQSPINTASAQTRPKTTSPQNRARPRKRSPRIIRPKSPWTPYRK